MDTNRVLITGGGGFLGSEIVRVLRERFPKVHLSVLDIPPEPPAKIKRCNVNYFQADVTDKEAIDQLIRDVAPDVVIHTAAVVPTRTTRYNQQERRKCFQVNVEGTRNVLEVAEASGVKCFVYTSSYTVITDNINYNFPNMDEQIPVGSATLVYGESKVVIHIAGICLGDGTIGLIS